MINDLALILIVAAVTSLVMARLRQPLVLGYIVAGFLVSPHMPYVASVAHVENVETWAEIGVMFLMFTLGLDFNFKKILRLGASPIIAALTIIFCMICLGMLVGKSFGWGRMDCIFLGGMLCMSSTTIIYKAFSERRSKKNEEWQETVLSVLIIEDVLAIILMIILSTIAIGGSVAGTEIVWSISKIVFFLVLWFVVGLFFIPRVLKNVRSWLNDEILLLLALGACCGMAVVSEKAGFSTVFGAFIMGSILSETKESEKIIGLVSSVKNLFGAIFFVSVGMLVDPAILVKYWGPILALVLTILIGQSVFGSMGFLLSGRQSVQNAMRCGFSMGQIGEFSFIIASLGLSLGVISNHIYPVVVAVSVITIFLTPYMIKLADPSFKLLEKKVPAVKALDKWQKRRTQISESQDSSVAIWHRFLKSVLLSALVFVILCIAIIIIMMSVVLPLVNNLIGERWGNIVCCITTILLISPFLRAMIVKKLHSEETQQLWLLNRLNRLPLIFTFLARLALAVAMIFYVVQHTMRMGVAVLLLITAGVVVSMVFSKQLKKNSIKLEQMFMENLKTN